MKRILFFTFLVFLQENLAARLPDLIPYRKGKLWGYCDSTKKIIIEPQYEEMDFFSGNTAVVKKNGKYGIIDRSGNAVSPFIFESIYPEAHGGNRLFTVSDDGAGENNSLMNEKGEVLVPAIEGYMSWISENYFMACRCHGRKRDVAIYNKDGRAITGYDYAEDESYYLTDEAADKYGLLILAKGKRMGVIDTTGKVIIPFEFFQINFTSCSEPRFECIGRKTSEWRNLNGEITDGYECPPENRYPKAIKIDSVSKTYYSSYNNAWEDSLGKIVTLPNLIEAGWFLNGYAVFRDKSLKKGIINEDFKIVVPAKYLSINYVDKNGIAYVQSEVVSATSKGKFGYVDIYGTEYWEE